MAALALGEISLSDADTGDNEVVFDVDPDSYRPLAAPVRGSVFPTLDGGAIRQVMGPLRAPDHTVVIEGLIATEETRDALLAKYRQPQGVYRLSDYLGNIYNVIFTPGQVSFEPVPIRGACDGMTYAMSFTVCTIVQYLGGSF